MNHHELVRRIGGDRLILLACLSATGSVGCREHEAVCPLAGPYPETSLRFQLQPPVPLPEGYSGKILSATGDFNRDGYADLIVNNDYDKGLIAALGHGNGQFDVVATKVTPGDGPVALGVGDFDGDGIPDVAALLQVSEWISVVPGRGNGTFLPAVKSKTGGWPTGMSIADFNADGRADVAVTNHYDHTVSVFLSTGGGKFAARIDYPTGRYPNALAVADWNADQRLDIAVVSNVGDYLTILLNQGDGQHFLSGQFELPSGSRQIAASDFNGDHLPDLAIGHMSRLSPTLTIHFGDGRGNFSQAADYCLGYGTGNIIAGDWNLDGRADLALTAGFQHYLTLLLSQKDGLFAPPHFLTSEVASASTYVTADFDGDRRPDLAITGQMITAERYTWQTDILLNAVPPDP